MKCTILFTSLLLVIFSPLVSVVACDPPKDSNDTTSNRYLLRGDSQGYNRCEGLKERPTGIGTFELISFFTSNLNLKDNYPQTLYIGALGTEKTPPTIKVQSFHNDYVLDDLKTTLISSIFTFNLDTTVLKRTRTPFQSLLFKAESNQIYIPVIVGKPSNSDEYKFIFSSFRPISISTVEIHFKNGEIKNGQPVPVIQPVNPFKNVYSSGKFLFTWNYGQVPAGTYVLHVEYKYDEGQKPISRNFEFKHEPKLFSAITLKK